MANTEEFIRKLGTKNTFVNYVRNTVTDNNYSGLRDFESTPDGKRYLLVHKGPTRIIDFRHFFAAMLLVLEGYHFLPRLDSGKALMAGVANELIQCTFEIGDTVLDFRNRINSCFSNEDLGTNRAGAEFGDYILRARAEASRAHVADLLSKYLDKFNPLSFEELAKLQKASTVSYNSGASVLGELMIAILMGIHDSLISKAY